jgi:glycosyltransferase involved in cell wall biosynthesis
MKVALSYRVIWHWRLPIFKRLAARPGTEFRAFYGSDHPGTKTVSAKNIEGIDHRRLFTLRINSKYHGERITFSFCPTLLIHLARFRPDVILTEGGSNILNNFLIFFYAGLTGTPVVWWTLGPRLGEGRMSLLQRIFRRTVVAMERRSASLLGYSTLATRYFDEQGYPKEDQFQLVNCVDTDLVARQREAAREQVEPLRRKLGLEGKKVLLYVGEIANTKRLEDLIDVYARLRQKHLDLRLVIVGDGEHRPALEEHARRAGAEDVIFTGRVIEGVSAYFLLGDVFVLPGLGGLAISQAMAHSLPVIATKADGCELDLVEDGQNGYILTPGDQDRMYAVLDQIVSDAEVLRKMSDHSRWIIDNKYNINTYMDALIAALDHAYESRQSKNRKKVLGQAESS